MQHQAIKLPEQGTQEWLDWRKDKVGASDAAAIMGVSPWTSIYDLWLEKTGQKPDKPTNRAMRRGIELEPQARMKAEEILGVCLDPVVMVHPLYSWMIASLDGINEDNTVMVEIKCPGPEDHQLAKEGRVPDKYFPQLQHQMAVTGLNWMYYFSYSDDDTWAILKVIRDQTYIDLLIDAERKFYECVMQRIPPDCRETRILEMEGEEWNTYNSAYQLAKRNKEASEKEMEYYKEKLLELSGGSEAQGMGFKLSKVVRKGTIDWKAICEKHSIDDAECEKFRKNDTEFWTVKKENLNG